MTKPVMIGGMAVTAAFVVHESETLSTPKVSRVPLPVLPFKAAILIQTFEP